MSCSVCVCVKEGGREGERTIARDMMVSHTRATPPCIWDS